jgi:bacterioferritin (cytochrome b1)
VSDKLTQSELWVASFYRVSEISGALFFGRIARSLKPGAVQRDMTKHFADEAQHAWLWTDCLQRMGAEPLKLDQSYQDQYGAAAGLPANLMEILAVTQVFEKRVINQYARHLNMPGVRTEIRDTLLRIMQDEQWHIEWIREALQTLEPEFGADNIAQTIERFRAADEEVYQKTLIEHEQRISELTEGTHGD